MDALLQGVLDCDQVSSYSATSCRSATRRVGVPDFRSDPMPSHEGRGIARRAWEAYARTVNRAALPVFEPLLDPIARRLAPSVIGDLVGFWMMWHLYGGFEGLETMGMHRTTIYRKISRFRRIFGQHPDEFEFPGVKVNPTAYWSAGGKKLGPRPKKS